MCNLQNQQRYANAIICLAAHGYDVTSDTPGYRISHISDPADVSWARHLDDLEDIASLIEWRRDNLATIWFDSLERPLNFSA